MATRAITTTANITPIKVVVVALLLLPAILLAVYGGARFSDGVAWDNSVPVPVYMVAQRAMPIQAYAHAAESLDRANPRNGAAILAATEAKLHAGENRKDLVASARDGLAHMPASPRGWLLLSELTAPESKKLAAAAISQSVMLGPREYYLLTPQLQDAARLWADLDLDTQKSVLAQVQMLWNTPILRDNLVVLCATPDGAAMVSRAFSVDEIREINRWLAHKRRKARSQ